MRPATALGLSLLATNTACLGAESIAQRAVPASLDAGVGFLEDPESQARIQRLLADPQIKRAAAELTASLVEGALDGAADETRQARLQRASAAYVDQLTRAAAAGLRHDLAPALARTARLSVEQALLGALSPRTREEAVALVDEVTRGALVALSEDLQTDLGPALRAVLEDDLGPALRRVVTADLAPALRDAVETELLPVVGAVTRESARQLVLGVADGFRELNAEGRLTEYENSFWGRLTGLLNKGIRVSQIVAWVLGLAVVALGLLLARTLLVRRRVEEERARSERMLLGVMDELQHARDKPEIEALLTQLRGRDPDLADEALFEELARRAAQKRVTRQRRRP